MPLRAAPATPEVWTIDQIAAQQAECGFKRASCEALAALITESGVEKGDAMTSLSYESLERFVHARPTARVEQAWRWLSRRPRALLCFDEVCSALCLSQMLDRGNQEIELARIIGSVAKGGDFTRAFRPRRAFNRDRWRRVDDLLATRGFDPIDVYAVGGIYFVVDGHHRVSVARANGVERLEAHITEWVSSIRLERDESLERIRSRLRGSDSALCTQA